MIKLDESVLKGTLIFSGILMLFSFGFFWVGENQGIAVLSGVMLSTIFVSSSAWIFDSFKDVENSLFTQIFFFSIAVRFLLVLALFGILLGATKIDCKSIKATS